MPRAASAIRPLRVLRRARGGGRPCLLFVKVSVKPGQLDAYKETIEAHIVNCFANDRCMYFDYGVSDEEPDVVHLYETYEDQAALDEHKSSAHLAEYLSKAEAFVVSHDVTTTRLARSAASTATKRRVRGRGRGTDTPDATRRQSVVYGYNAGGRLCR